MPSKKVPRRSLIRLFGTGAAAALLAACQAKAAAVEALMKREGVENWVD